MAESEVYRVFKPGEKEFCSLAGEYDIIPVYKTAPADLETPISIYLKLAAFQGETGESFLLESGELGEKSRYSIIGVEPFRSLSAGGGETLVQGEKGERWRDGGDPLKVLKDILESDRVYQPQELAPFRGGAVGYISYDAVGKWEKVTGLPDESAWPLCYFYFPGKIIIYDHRKHLMTGIYLARIKDKKDPAAAYSSACVELQSLFKHLNRLDCGCRHDFYHKNCSRAAGAGDGALSEGVRGGLRESVYGDIYGGIYARDAYTAAVEKARDYIRAGDIFQVVLSRRAQQKTTAHPLTVYRALRSLNPSPYQFFLSFPHFQLVGSSPEMLVRLENGFAYTKPIAGTRPRGIDEKGDASLAAELSRDEKERAEHMMLVDLGRNDIGRVSRYGTVEVTKLLEGEYFSHVMHLVSEVKGEIRPGLDFADLLRAVFPAGTVSGAPKVRAMEIIAELEQLPRGPYAGAVGYVGFDGDMDTCITIRTVLMEEGAAYVQAGAGIVLDSDPSREYEETEHKMAGSLRAIQMAEEWENDINY